MGGRASYGSYYVRVQSSDMGESVKMEKVGGLLQSALKGTPLAGLDLTPQLTERELVIEMDEKQFRDLVMANADERAKQAVTIEILQGKIRIKVRLF